MLFLILLLATVFCASYLIIFRNTEKDYWKKRGVKHEPKNTSLGILWDFFVHRNSLAEILKGIYDKHEDEPYVGIFVGCHPFLMLRHPKNIEKVIVGDFQNFSSRGRFVNKCDVLGQNIAFTDDYKKWKLSRKTFSPLFTDNKLRKMFCVMKQSANEFVECVERELPEKQYNMNDLLPIYCDAVISPTLLGVKPRYGTGGFVVDMCKQVFPPSLREYAKYFVGSMTPKLYRLMKMKSMGACEKEFTSLFETVIKSNSQVLNSSPLVTHVRKLQELELLRDLHTEYALEPTNEFFAAQTFFFVVAGIDVAGVVLNFALTELAQNCDILERLHKEIDSIFDKNDGDLSYDAINQFEYVSMVLKETLRKYPPIATLQRKCTGAATFPVGGQEMLEGDKLIIPIYSLHRDPKYYPNPELFDPERFSAQNILKINKMVYLPFGGGYRTCLGQSFAVMQLKVCLITLLRRFTLKYYSKEKPKLSQTNLVLKLKNPGYSLIPRQLKVESLKC